MNIIYFGKIIEKNFFEEVKSNKKPYFVAQYRFEEELISQFNNLDINYTINSIYQLETFPKNQFLFFRKGLYNYLGYINLPFLKELCYFVGTIISILKEFKKDDPIIFLATHYVPVSAGVIFISKILNIPVVLTITDLSSFSYSKSKKEKVRGLKKVIFNKYGKLAETLQNKFDSYVFFSEKMKDIIDVSNKDYLVIEGLFNPEGLDIEFEERKRNAITYAGTLDRLYGIETIIETFLQLQNKNLDLWLIGKGDYEDEILKIADKHPNVKYFGFLQREEVFKLLKQSKLLLNLRDNKESYTKYSFPSKMFEYMVSGTPVFTTRLEGIPGEYYNYIYSTNSNDIDSYVKEINNILDLSEEVILKKGESAKAFILNMKSSNKSVIKINKLLLRTIERKENKIK